MSWLNYHHLQYFWTVAREGGVSAAARRLHLSPSAISSQIKELERALGAPLLARRGRRVEPTAIGKLVLGYADEIFTLGRELFEVARDRGAPSTPVLRVGIADVLPKAIAHALLAPALELAEPVRLMCREDRPERLFPELAAHELDLVLSDAPLGEDQRLKAFSHLLGECDVTFVASRRLAEKLKPGFPASLDGAPLLVPAPHTALRRALGAWFDERDLAPRLVGEFDDTALLKTFGQSGLGAFAVPSAVEADVRRQFDVLTLGRVASIRERYYAISPERKIRHPAVLAITRAARRELFA